jgi:hypothetical protein
MEHKKAHLEGVNPRSQISDEVYFAFVALGQKGLHGQEGIAPDEACGVFLPESAVTCHIFDASCSRTLGKLYALPVAGAILIDTALVVKQYRPQDICPFMGRSFMIPL